MQDSIAAIPWANSFGVLVVSKNSIRLKKQHISAIVATRSSAAFLLPQHGTLRQCALLLILFDCS
jgi:hypothetical protein